MEVKRVTNPKIIKYLRPLFIEDGAFSRDIIAKELFEVMISSPEEIFVVIIFEEDKIYGFGVAWLMGDRDYIWLAQAWSKSGSDRKYSQIAIEMMKQWAIKEFNIHKIRFETDRNPEAIERAWGFKFHATVMECEF